MSEANQEPTMEEILASIRRIISEDDAPSAEAAPEPAAAPAAVMPEPEPEPEPIHAAVVEEEDEVLELTERVQAPAPMAEVETHGDLDVFPLSEPEPAPAPRARAVFQDEEPAWKPREEEPLVSGSAAQEAASAFGQLARTLAMPEGSRTLEDVVRELLRPLLKQWLDEHLPDIVQAKVDSEVERIARGRVR